MKMVDSKYYYIDHRIDRGETTVLVIKVVVEKKSFYIYYHSDDYRTGVHHFDVGLTTGSGAAAVSISSDSSRIKYLFSISISG